MPHTEPELPTTILSLGQAWLIVIELARENIADPCEGDEFVSLAALQGHAVNMMESEFDEHFTIDE